MHKILLIEDELMISEPFTIVLRTEKDFAVDVASNGLQALEFCKQKTYDVILLDLMMPVCDGVSFLQLADLQHTAPKTRVALLTNLSTGNDLEKAMKLGAHKVQLKANLDPKSLIALVREELATKNQ